MEAVREAWTDERLDDLKHGMDRGFDRVDARLEKVDARFEKLEDRFDRVDRNMRDLRVELEAKMDDRFGRLDARFDSLWRMMLAGYVTAVFGFIVTRIG